MGAIKKHDMVQLAFPRQAHMQLALPLAVLSVSEFGTLRFGHHLTKISGESRAGRPSGTTVWVAGDDRGQCVAISWDWCVVDQGVLCLSDPLGITSNAWLVHNHERTSPIKSTDRLKAFVEAVYRMGWEARVQEYLPSRPAA